MKTPARAKSGKHNKFLNVCGVTTKNMDAQTLYRHILENIEENRHIVSYIRHRMKYPMPLCDLSVLQVDLDEAIKEIRKGRKEALRVKCLLT